MEPPPRILIAYGTSYGSTGRIAAFLHGVLRERGCEVLCSEAKNLPRDFAIEGFEGAILAGSIVVGKHQKPLERFVRTHRAWLASHPCAFFSVSGSAGGTDAKQHAEAERMLQEFLTKTEWHPPLTATFGGMIAYTKYNPFLRFMMRRIAAAEGGSTDTSRDHEYTDWARVQAFAGEFLALFAS